MKLNTFALLLVVLSLAGCGSDMPIKKIGGTTKEYVVNRDDKGPFGNLPDLKRRVMSEARAFCETQGKVFVERYSLDKERAVLVWPETTLYFECADRQKN